MGSAAATVAVPWSVCAALAEAAPLATPESALPENGVPSAAKSALPGGCSACWGAAKAEADAPPCTCATNGAVLTCMRRLGSTGAGNCNAATAAAAAGNCNAALTSGLGAGPNLGAFATLGPHDATSPALANCWELAFAVGCATARFRGVGVSSAATAHSPVAWLPGTPANVRLLRRTTRCGVTGKLLLLLELPHAQKLGTSRGDCSTSSTRLAKRSAAASAATSGVS